jgi:hypothetical protein
MILTLIRSTTPTCSGSTLLTPPIPPSLVLSEALALPPLAFPPTSSETSLTPRFPSPTLSSVPSAAPTVLAPPTHLLPALTLPPPLPTPLLVAPSDSTVSVVAKPTPAPRTASPPTLARRSTTSTPSACKAAAELYQPWTERRQHKRMTAEVKFWNEMR